MTTLGALTDVTLTGPLAANQVLVNNGAGQWVNQPLNLGDLGDVDAATPTAGQTIVWDPAANAGAGGYVLGTAGGNATLFLPDTTVAPASAGFPTLAEIATAAGANRDRVLIYSGTDNAADPIIRAYHIDSAGLVTLVNEPSTGAAANPIVHLTDTAVGPATAGQPTLAEITAAAGGNRDVFLAYTGTDNAGDPVVSSYYIDSAGTVALVHEPQVASCQMREVGGVGGDLAVGDGLGIPNPVQDDYIIRSDRAVGVVTAAPAGGSSTFEVRIMPGGAVLTTGTIAAGATAATFTPFADTAVAAGQWIETVVTTVAPTPGSQLTVAAEMCGPGAVSATTGGGADLDAYVHTQAAASALWTVVHNLNREVAVRVEDATGADIVPDEVTTIDSNTVTIAFLVATDGRAVIT